MKPATGRIEKQEQIIRLAFGAVLVLTVVVLCAAFPYLTIAALLGLIGFVLVGPVRAMLLLLVAAIPLFPSLRGIASLTTVRCDVVGASACRTTYSHCREGDNVLVVLCDRMGLHWLCLPWNGRIDPGTPD